MHQAPPVDPVLALIAPTQTHRRPGRAGHEFPMGIGHLRFGNSRNRSTDARSRRCRRALGRSAHATDVEWEVMGLRRLAPPPGCGCLALVAGVLVVVGQTAAQCNAPTDADCFRQFLAGRTGVDALPECDGEQATDGSALSGSWCRCAASVGGTLDNFVGWIDDDSCDRLFDTEACYEDGGDCTPSARRCHTALSQRGIVSACGFNEDPAGTFILPQTCTPGCAELFLPWQSECSWEEEIGGHPAWVWAGFEWACSLTLSSITTECDTGVVTGANPTAWSAAQQCDGRCDCPACDDEDACDHLTSVCDDELRCTCNSGAMLPFAWVCDGVHDCGMGEDESVASCGLKGVQSIDVYGTALQASGSNRHCANRWRSEVEASCSAGVGSSQSSCSSTCAAAFLPWFLDCKEAIVDSAGASSRRLASELNRHFMCCMDGTCTLEQQDNLVGCDGSTVIESLGDLADDECTASLNCAKFGRDGGDCDKRTSARVRYIVSGPVGPDEFVAAMADNIRWLSAEDVTVLEFQQLVTGAVVISSPAVAGLYMSRPASRDQLKSAIGSWLHVPMEDVAIESVHDVESDDRGRRQRRRLQRDSHSVRVAFTIASGKDVTGPFDSTIRAGIFREILNQATPRVIDQLAATDPEDNVRFETPTVETEIVCDITVGYFEYEQALGLQLPDFADLSSEIQVVLMDGARMYQSLTTACSTSLCATAVQAQQISLTVADLGRGNTIPEPPSPREEEAGLLGPGVAVIGGAIGVYALISCVQYGLRLKQKRTLMVYSDGVQIGVFETLADELQRQVLERVIVSWKMREELKTEAVYDANKDSLASTGDINTLLENPLLVPECTDATIGGPAKISEDSLLEAMDSDHTVPIASRSMCHQEAEARLISARAATAARQKAALEKAGLSADVIEELGEEVVDMDEDADSQIATLNASLDQAEVQLLHVHGHEFARQFGLAKTEVSRHAIQDQYNASLAETLHKLATKRAQERFKLCETLMARRSALAKTHEDSLIGAVLDSRAQDEQSEQDRTKLQEMLSEMKQNPDDLVDSDPNESQDALACLVLRSIVIRQEERCAAEIDYWLHYATQARSEQQKVAEARRTRRSEARNRLVQARGSLLDAEMSALVKSGVSEAVIKEQFAEILAVQTEQDSQREDFEAEMDQKQEKLVLTRTAQFEAAKEACASSAARETLVATYATQLEVTYAQLESARAEQRAKLNARLGRRIEMLGEQHAKAMQSTMMGNESDDVTGVVQGLSKARAQVEAREIALANARPQQNEYMKLLIDMQKPYSAGDNSLVARRNLVQERLAERRQEMAEKHRNELRNAGVPEDVIEHHITDMQVNDSLGDREVERIEEEAEREQQSIIESGGNISETNTRVASKRMATRRELRTNLRSRRAALESKQGAELARTAPAAVEVFTRQIAEREQLDSLLASAYIELASTRAERDTDEASRHKELVRLKNDMDGAKHVIMTKAMELERELDLLVKEKDDHRPVAILGGDDDVAPIMEDYNACLDVITQKTKVNPGDADAVRLLQSSIKKKVATMQFLAHQALDLLEGASSSISSGASSRYSASSGGREGLPLSV